MPYILVVWINPISCALLVMINPISFVIAREIITKTDVFDY